MSIAVTRAAAQGSESALRAGFRTQMRWSIGIVLASGIVSLYYFLNDNNTLAFSFLIVGAFAPFVESFRLYRSYLLGKQRFRESTTLGLWRRPLPIIAILAALYFTGDPVLLVFVYFSSNALSLGLMYWLVIRRYSLPATEDAGLTNYSKHLSVMNIFTTVTNNVDKILIFHFLGAAPLASYALAQLPVTQLRSMLGLIKPLTLPKITKKSFEELQSFLPAKIRLVSMVTIAIIVLYIVSAPFLFSLLFPSFPESTIYSQVLALLLLGVPRQLIMQAFTAHERKRELYIVRTAYPITRVAFLIVLLPLYGIWGAIIALIVAEVSMMMLQLFLFRKTRSNDPETASTEIE
jgi:O-antigen/teichoic acid export membrane protein